MAEQPGDRSFGAAGSDQDQPAARDFRRVLQDRRRVVVRGRIDAGDGDPVARQIGLGGGVCRQRALDVDVRERRVAPALQSGEDEVDVADRRKRVGRRLPGAQRRHRAAG